MCSNTAEENLVHRHSLLEDGQVFAEIQYALVPLIRTHKQCNTVTEWTILPGVQVKVTHASSSCFILVNSSLVMEPSPSPSFCSFSREASKSGLGGAGGIWQQIYDHFYHLPCVQICFAFWLSESNGNGALTLMISVVTVSLFKCTNTASNVKCYE